MELVSIDWRYKGEGASNVVLDYQGSDPVLKGNVLRVRKARYEGEPVLSDLERRLWKNWPSVSSAGDEEELRHAFVRDVIRPLLGEDYVDPGMVVPVSREFLVDLSKKIRPKRPGWRAEEADLDFSSRNVLLVGDHTQLFDVPGESPTVSIEIKPKWGYLPNSDAIANRNHMKKEVSRFRMHQLLKHSQGKIRELSSYCPLDLFSGTREKVDKALKALFTCPQNNLRLFVDGNRVFTGSVDGSLDSTDSDAVVELLESSLADFSSSDKGTRIGSLRKLVAQLLCGTDALGKLLDAQKGDVLDIEGGIHVYYRYSEVDCPVCESGGGLDSGDLSHRRVISGLHSLPVEEQEGILCSFLTAATAKDCSLMVTLKPVEENSSQVVSGKVIRCPNSGRLYYYKISFLDLDLKRLDKLPYYFRLDQSIVKLYLENSSGNHSESQTCK